MNATSDMAARVCFFLTIYNEAAALPKLLEDISKIPLPPGITAYSVYAVDDASTDDTPRVLEALAQKYPLSYLRYEKNVGVPETFKRALKYFSETLGDDDIVVLMEGDGTSDTAAAPAMLAKILEGSDLVIASRHVKGGKYARFPWYRVLGSSLINLFLRVMWGVSGATDYTIFYRAYRVSLLKKEFLQPDFKARKSFAINGEILLKLSVHDPKVAEVPLVYDYGLKKGPSRMNLVAALKEYMRLTRIYRFNLRSLAKFFMQPVTLVALGTLFLQLWGSTYGFPDLLVLDEPALTRGALTMLKEQTLIPALDPAAFATMYYPPFTAYLYLLALVPVMGVAFLFSHLPLSTFTTNLLLDPTLPWVTTRAVSGLFGALSVFALGRLAEKVYKGSGVFAALFLATSFLHVTFAHIARHWSLSTLIVVLLMYTAYSIYRSGRRSAYVAAGVLAGIGAGTGVVTMALAMLPGLMHFFRPGMLLQKFKDLSVWIFCGIAVILMAVFFALHPLVLSNLLAGGESQGITLDAHKSLLGFVEMSVIALRDMAQSETTVLVFGLIGIPYLLRRRARFAAALLASCVAYLGVIYVGYYYLLHYLQLLLPIGALFAGVALFECVSLTKRHWLRWGIALLVLALPLSVAMRFSYLWTQPDTRHLARTYVEMHIPKNAKIVSNVAYMKVVWPTKEALHERIQFDPSSSRLLDTTLLALATSSYPNPAFDVFELSTLSASGTQALTKEFFAAQQFEYAIVDRSAVPVAAFEALVAQGTVVAEFPGHPVGLIANEFGGPATDVFKVEQMGPEVAIVRLTR